MRRKPTVHDTAMTGGDGPRMHHVCFATHEKHNILAICDKLGALRRSDAIERGPGRHGVSNAFYLYLRDPDGHRVEIYTQDYYTAIPTTPSSRGTCTTTSAATGGATPSSPPGTARARSCSILDGNPQPVRAREDSSEMAVTIGADGFSYTRAPEERSEEFKLGNQL